MKINYRDIYIRVEKNFFGENFLKKINFNIQIH